MTHKFAIGDYVALKAHVDLYELHEVMPLMVLHRCVDECEAGPQLWYECRLITPPLSKCASADHPQKVKELELVPLDVPAYRAAVEANRRPSLRSIEKGIESIGKRTDDK